MIRGAVQVATDGTPIVLGPDHPVTGGYPVLAVVRRADQPKLARRRPGEEIRFRPGRQ
jgi:allophanate hydrolase subunit 2